MKVSQQNVQASASKAQAHSAPSQSKADASVSEFQDLRPEATAQRQLSNEIAEANTNSVENNTGLPNQLKTGIESLSGHSLDDVKVHYNSAKPAQLNAHGYAQGSDIHVASGQEKHLPHEAWHVVQQKQGRVQPTMQMQGVAVNNDVGLETEADVMGAKALQLKSMPTEFVREANESNTSSIQKKEVVQLAGEEFLASLLSPTGLLTMGVGLLGTAYLAYSWWPAGRTPRDLFNIGRQIGFARQTIVQDVLALANIAGWNSASIITLAGSLGTNDNGLAVAQWVTLAGRVQANDHAAAASWAQIPNWTYAGGINALSTVLNPNNLTAAQWSTVAGRVGNDAVAEAQAFGQIANWTYGGGINTLSNAYTNHNPNNLTPVQWAALATRVPNDDHASAIAFAGLNGWNNAGISSCATDFQNNNIRNFNGVQWLAIAQELGANQHAECRAFASLVSWTANDCRLLARRYSVDNNAGRSHNTWATVANLDGGLLNGYVSVRDFLRLPVGWADIDIIGLAREYSQDAGGRNSDGWARVANAHAYLHNNRMDVANFARLPNAVMNNVHVVALANLFGVDQGGLTSIQWLNITQSHANFNDQEADVAAFARIPNWTYIHKRALAGNFGGGANGKTSVQWEAIATANPVLHDNVADTTAFARMANWTGANIATLAGSFGANNPNVYTSAQWIAIANAHAILHDVPVDTALFAQMPNWTHANTIALVQGKGGGNARNFTATQWIQIANGHAGLYNQTASVAAFAQMATWAHASILQLSAHFAANANGRTAPHWITIANAHVNLLNQANDARDFCLVNNLITAAQLAQILPLLLPTLNAVNSIALLGRLHPDLTPARLTALIAAPVDVNNLSVVSQGAFGGNSFANRANALIAGAWSAPNVATAVADFDTPVNQPSANNFTMMLDLAQRRGIAVGDFTDALQNSLIAAAGDWAIVCQEYDNFINAGHAQPAGPFGLGGAVLNNSAYYSAGVPNIYVDMQYTQNRLNHFEAGHTYDHFNFTWANAHRVGSPYSLWAAATNVATAADNAVGNGMRGEANTAIRGNAFTQGAHGGDVSGFAPPAGLGPLVNANTYAADMTMFYPAGGNLATRINEHVVDAIGRMMGHI